MTNHPKPLMGKPEEFTAGEPSKTEEFNSPTPADELNYDAAFRATDSTTAVASYQDCSGSAAPLEPNRGWDDAEQGLMPTPADEEVARALVGLLIPYEALLIDGESRKWIAPEVWSAIETGVQTARTALAEARRAGTPTTEARERARKIVDEWGGNILPVSTKDYDRSRHGLIDRIASALSSTPGDEVAQRAWLPIESAPKNGVLFLAWVIEDGAGMVRFVNWGKCAHVPLYGFCTRDNGAEDDSLCSPIYWMPLPDPPVEARRQEREEHEK